MREYNQWRHKIFKLGFRARTQFHLKKSILAAKNSIFR